MEVDEKSAAGSVSHHGSSYYFCGPGCRQKFEADPARYLQPRTDTARVSPEDHAGEYTCPMHPEVRQPGPGTCPKCGMALESVAIPAGRVQYVCPMHPEIVRDEPGNCPICGMALEPREISAVAEENPELRDMTRRFWVSLGLAIPVLLAGMSEYLPGDPLHRLAPASFWTWFELVLATPVVLWGGWPFFVRAWQSVLNRSLNMFTRSDWVSPLLTCTAWWPLCGLASFQRHSMIKTAGSPYTLKLPL
jgi:Cu+-exporting ATPase